MNNKGKLAIAASVIAAFASVGIMGSQAHASSQTNAPAVISPLASIPTADAPEAAGTGVDAGNVQSGEQSGDQTSPDVAGAAGDEGGSAIGAVDADNVQSGDQSGDQTGPDTAGTADSGSNN